MQKHQKQQQQHKNKGPSKAQKTKKNKIFLNNPVMSDGGHVCRRHRVMGSVVGRIFQCGHDRYNHWYTQPSIKN